MTFTDISSKDKILAIGFTVECVATAVWYPPLNTSETWNLMMIAPYTRNL